MDTGLKRRDPVTGAWSVHPDLQHKPFTLAERHLPEPAGPCTFCMLAAEPVNEHGEIRNGTQISRLDHTGPHTFALANRWRPFEESSGAQLVIARRHVSSVEELEPDELVEFLTVLLSLRERQATAFHRTLAFVNVGLEVNGTQPHLHGQVVSSDLEAPAPLAPGPTAESLAEDVTLGRAHDLIVAETATFLTYCPWAPTASGETRVTASTREGLAKGVLRALDPMLAVFGNFPYNLVVHGGSTMLVQIVPRFTAVGILPDYFGMTVITVPPEELAPSLREQRAGATA